MIQHGSRTHGAADRVWPTGSTPGTRVVVVGAGFGGLWAAKALAGNGLDVLLLDRNNYHTFLPLLYQVAAAELAPSDIAYPIRSILRKSRDIRFRLAEIHTVDLSRRVVESDAGPVPYDYLILALGSVPHFFGVEGASIHAFPLREMGDAIPLRHHTLSRFEAASHEMDPARRRGLLTFAIVGGGPTGVEYAGALSELVYGPLLVDYPSVSPDEIRVLLLEAGDTLLKGMPPKLRDYAYRRLRRRRVEVRLDAAVTRVTSTSIHLADGTVEAAATVAWTAGVRGEPRVEKWGFPVTAGGRVPLAPALHLENHPEVYVVGDLAYVEEDGHPLPQVAPVAIQQGEHAATCVIRAVAGIRPEPFRYQDPGMLAVIGRNAAVARIWGRSFTGLPAWALWLAIHITKLIGFRNRVLVLVNWAWNYLSFRRTVRLILPSSEGRSGSAGS